MSDATTMRRYVFEDSDTNRTIVVRDRTSSIAAPLSIGDPVALSPDMQDTAIENLTDTCSILIYGDPLAPMVQPMCSGVPGTAISFDPNSAYIGRGILRAAISRLSDTRAEVLITYAGSPIQTGRRVVSVNPTTCDAVMEGAGEEIVAMPVAGGMAAISEHNAVRVCKNLSNHQMTVTMYPVDAEGLPIQTLSLWPPGVGLTYDYMPRVKRPSKTSPSVIIAWRGYRATVPGHKSICVGSVYINDNNILCSSTSAPIELDWGNAGYPGPYYEFSGFPAISDVSPTTGLFCVGWIKYKTTAPTENETKVATLSIDDFYVPSKIDEVVVDTSVDETEDIELAILSNNEVALSRRVLGLLNISILTPADLATIEDAPANDTVTTDAVLGSVSGNPLSIYESATGGFACTYTRTYVSSGSIVIRAQRSDTFKIGSHHQNGGADVRHLVSFKPGG